MLNPLCPNGTGVFIDTEDGRLDLADVDWLLTNSEGRIVGIAWAATGPDEFDATPASALRRFADSKRDAERMKRDGYTCRPREHAAACDEYAAHQAR